MDFKRILAALFLMIAVPCLVAEEASGTSMHLIQVFPSFSELIVGGACLSLDHCPQTRWNYLKLDRYQSPTLVVPWIVALGIIFVVQLATRNVKLVPEGIQNFCRVFGGGFVRLFRSVVGDHMIHRTFFLATAFIFILFANWFGLIPGLGTIIGGS